MRILFTMIAICGTCVALNACNTIGGVGQDIQAGGNAITNAAR